MPNLAPYLHNGQLNSTVLFQGETATLLMTFYSGQDYRILVCHHKLLEGTYFTVSDTDDNLIYSSKDKDSNQWDFNVVATQQLHIQVLVPEMKMMFTDMVQSGCVSVMLGFRE